MQKALVIKELRESAGIVILALFGVAYLLAELTATPIMPWQNSYLYTYPFVWDSTQIYLWFLGGALALALGFRQTAWELSHGTYFFLLHRPISRRAVFGVKLLVGLTLLMLIAALYVVLFTWWSATPGHFDAPFFLSMTVPAWRTWISLPPVYLGAFLAGIRPGRWFGSRLVPVVAGFLAAVVASNMPWFWLSAVLSIAASALLAVAIFYYVQVRDY
jgi:hypothetical protein